MGCRISQDLNFSIVSDNDDMIQMNIDKKSDCLPASIQSAQWEMFLPGTQTAVITKTNSDITIVDRTVNGVLYPASAIRFLIDHTDTDGLDEGLYPHEATIVTTDGRIHTVTQGDAQLSDGAVFLRTILTPAPE